MNKLFLLLLLAAIIVSACTSNTGEASSELSGEKLEMTGATPISSVLPTRTPTRVVPLLDTDNADTYVTEVPIETVTIADVSETSAQRVCTMLPRQFDLRTELNINRVADLRFEEDKFLLFEGWADRPAPSVFPVTPEPTPSILPEPYPSARLLLVAGQLNINESKLEPRDFAFEPLLNNPCGETCPIEIISQSPDKEWQLVQVSDWLREKMGIWMVGEENMLRLIPYVPADMNWEWATDSSILWFIYSDPDRGGHSLLVLPGNPIEVKEEEHGSPLDPTFYFPSFSPTEKLVLSTANPFEQDIDTNVLYTIDITDITKSVTQTTSTEIVSGIVSADWNDATQGFLFQIIYRNSTEIEKVEIRDLAGQLLVTVPQSLIYTLTPNLTEDIVPFYRFSLPQKYALSSSGRYLAVASETGEILLFDCTLQN